MIRLYTPKQSTLEGILFQYSFKNATQKIRYNLLKTIYILVRMILDFLSVQSAVNGEKVKLGKKILQLLIGK